MERHSSRSVTGALIGATPINKQAGSMQATGLPQRNNSLTPNVLRTLSMQLAHLPLRAAGGFALPCHTADQLIRELM